MQVVIITGMSGAGKSYALHSLEDADYYCIDNLPSELLEELLQNPQIQKQKRLAVGIDIRGGTDSLEQVPDIIDRVRQQYENTHLVYLYATADVLLKRYNETRRRHPLDGQYGDLRGSISTEEQLLAPLAQTADLRIDTSKSSVYELGHLLRKRLGHAENTRMSLMIQSFGFKHESPTDSDFMFDVRCLPNPYWQPDIRHHVGNEPEIIQWLEQHDAVERMFVHVRDFLTYWLEESQGVQRSYLTVSIGCTGGRHRSVYIAERLYRHFQQQTSGNQSVLLHHRELQ